MKSMMKDAAILFAITLISGLLLGVVYEVTKEPIALQEIKRKNEACKEVFQDATNFEALELSEAETMEKKTATAKQRMPILISPGALKRAPAMIRM